MSESLRQKIEGYNMRNKRYFLTEQESNNFVHCTKYGQDVQINKTCRGSKKEESCPHFKGGGYDRIQDNNFVFCDFGEFDSNVQLYLKENKID